jgi:preprotein translocase subunit SecG
MFYVLTVVVHIVVSTILVLSVLLQTGKRADLAGAFGGGGSQTAFGARGAATILGKITTGAAIMFMVTSLTLSILSGSGDGSTSALDATEPAVQEVPAGEISQEPIPVVPSEPVPD